MVVIFIALIWAAGRVYAQDNIFDAANAATDWEIFDMPGAAGPGIVQTKFYFETKIYGFVDFNNLMAIMYHG